MDSVLDGMAQLWINDDDEKLWRSYAQNYFGDYANELKEDRETWRDCILTFHKTISHILSMEHWLPEDIEEVISDENFAKLEKLLLKNLELMIIANSKPLINSNKDLLAALLAYSFVGFSVADIAARYTKWNAAWIVAWHAADKAARRAYCWDAYNTTSTLTERASQSFAWKAMEKIRNICNIEGADNIEGAHWKVRFLFVLAHMSQKNYVEQHFIRGFKIAQGVLAADLYFNLSNVQILDIWAKKTWAKPELVENPYIDPQKNYANTGQFRD